MNWSFGEAVPHSRLRESIKVLLPVSVRQLVCLGALWAVVAAACSPATSGTDHVSGDLSAMSTAIPTVVSGPKVGSGVDTAKESVELECVTGGAVLATGARLMEPVLRRGAELYLAECPGLRIVIDVTGDDAGYQLVCGGLANMVGAVRPPNLDEIAQCASAGVDITTLTAGHHAFAVVFNESNPLRCLSVPDIAVLATAASRGSESWAEAAESADNTDNPGDSGSATVFPDLPLSVYGVGRDHQAFTALVNLLQIGDGEIEGQADGIGFRPALSADEVIAAVANTKGGVGFVPFSSFSDPLPPGVKIMSVASETGERCVAPSLSSIEAGNYPLASSLFVSVGIPVGGNQSVETFVGSAITSNLFKPPLADSIGGGGYIALGPEHLAEAQAAWRSR